jgi:hypothetical protein
MPQGLRNATIEYMEGSGRFEKAPSWAHGIAYYSGISSVFHFIYFNRETQQTVYWTGTDGLPYMEPANGYAKIVVRKKTIFLPSYDHQQASQIFGTHAWYEWWKAKDKESWHPSGGKYRIQQLLCSGLLTLDDGTVMYPPVSRRQGIIFPDYGGNKKVIYALHTPGCDSVVFHSDPDGVGDLLNQSHSTTPSMLTAKLRAFIQEPTPNREQFLSLSIPVLVAAVVAFYMTRRGRASAEAAAAAVGSACRPSEPPLSSHNRSFLQQAQLVTAMRLPASAVFHSATGTERKEARVACRVVQEMLGEGKRPQHRTVASLLASLVALMPFVWYSDSKKRAGLVALLGWALLVGAGSLLHKRTKKNEVRWRDTLHKLNLFFENEGMPEVSTSADLGDVVAERVRKEIKTGDSPAKQRMLAMRIVKKELGLALPLAAVVDGHMQPHEGPALMHAVVSFVAAYQKSVETVKKAVQGAVEQHVGGGDGVVVPQLTEVVPKSPFMSKGVGEKHVVTRKLQ